MAAHTRLAIRDSKFYLDDVPTYRGRRYHDLSIEGLLLNSRMVQGTFDDLNPATRSRWHYPDGPWDPERNVREFLAAMPLWRRHGLLGFTLNLQGGSPQGYSNQQPWHNSAFTAEGSLRPDYLDRLARILDAAMALRMVPIVGLFYFGQDQRLTDEAAVVRGVDLTVDWLLERGYTHCLVEVNNECNVLYDHAILQPERVSELITRVKERSRGRLLAGTSYGGGTVPHADVVAASDVLLLHGNGVEQPERIRAMVRQTREVQGYAGQPIVFNEDDHYDFDQPDNNFLAALSVGASWGYFDYRRPGEGFADGYQSVPCDWGIGSARKRGFFGLLAEVTGS